MVNLQTKVGEFEFKYPIGLASCSLGSNYKQWKKAVEKSEGKLGFIVTKSTRKEPSKGFGGKYGARIIDLPQGIINAEGLPNSGMKGMREEIDKYLKAGFDIPLIGSVGGFDEDTIIEVADFLADSGIVALELNYSCPHSDSSKGMANYLIGQRPELVRDITGRVKDKVGIPIIVKLSPYTDKIGEVAQAAKEGGADALTVTNTLPSVVLDTRKGKEGKPKLSNIYGGGSGLAILPHTVYNILKVSSSVDLPIFGSGGAGLDVNSNPNIEGVLQHIYAGASAVQVCTAFYKKGFGIVPELIERMENYMTEHSFKSLDEMVGLSHQYQKVFDDSGRLIGNKKIEK